jgi:hypothetical protein
MEQRITLAGELYPQRLYPFHLAYSEVAVEV